jgi:hypothetical protein
MTKSISLLFTIGLITLGFLGAVTLTGCAIPDNRPPCPTSRIKSVGGCDKYGTCGVMLEDGTEYMGSFPVVGGKVYLNGCKTVTP